MYRQKSGHTSSLVPSLKTFRDLPSSRVALDSRHSTKQSLLPVSSVCVFVCLFLKTCIYSTLDLNQETGVGSGESNRVGGWVTGTEVESQMCPGFHGAAPALRAPAPPTPLASTLIYLSSVGNQMRSLFKVTRTQRQLELKQNMLLNHGSDKGLGQGPQKELN